ncbi:MAG: hypothetical protein D6710_08010 [Nitrospirae bacterium]|nr:MAG: hypothetical protein D6710_08010 [Nitrospirota bacterium]
MANTLELIREGVKELTLPDEIDTEFLIKVNNLVDSVLLFLTVTNSYRKAQVLNKKIKIIQAEIERIKQYEDQEKS